MSETPTPRLPTLELPPFLEFLKLKSLPLKVYPPVNQPKRITNDTLYIYGPGPRDSAASFDVDCLIAQIYMRFCGVDVAIVNSNEPKASPSGQLPYFATVTGQVLAGDQIEQWIKDNNKDVLLDQLKDEAIAFMAMLKSKLHAAWLFSMWLEPLNYSEHALPLYFGHVPAPVNSILGRAKKDHVTQQLLTDRDVLSREEIYADAGQVLEALSVKLGENTYFFGKSEPTLMDAVVFAYLHCILSVPPVKRPDAAREEKNRANTLATLVHKHENLVQYAKHIFREYLK
ncbi:hypothetical protein BC940DRAFT_237233 [Gongronella butleri]|nr:hypothetical protein BC940DRAFT_237233 [Gongronella butleri]